MNRTTLEKASEFYFQIPFESIKLSECTVTCRPEIIQGMADFADAQVREALDRREHPDDAE